MPSGSPQGAALVPFASSFVATSALICVLLATVALTKKQSETAPSVASALNSVTERLCDIEKAVKASTEAVGASAKVVASAIALANAMPPLLFRNADLGENEELSASSRGVRLEETHRARLHQAVQTIASNCEIPDKAKKLLVEVVGYSSEAPFRCADDTDELNVQAANLRGRGVAQALRSMFDKTELRGRVAVRSHRWSCYDEIERPQFADGPALTQPDSWLVQRSVFVRLVNPSVCWT